MESDAANGDDGNGIVHRDVRQRAICRHRIGHVDRCNDDWMDGGRERYVRHPAGIALRDFADWNR